MICHKFVDKLSQGDCLVRSAAVRGLLVLRKCSFIGWCARFRI